MKLLLIALLSALAPVTGQLAAPQMAVFFVNESASPTACSSAESAYLDKQMLPDITATFQENNYLAPDWSVTTATVMVVDDLKSFATTAAAAATTSSSNCDVCRRMYPRAYCNGMYSCGYRRQLRGAEARKLASDDTLKAGLVADCQNKLTALAFSPFLGKTCRTAIKTAICQVMFIESNNI